MHPSEGRDEYRPTAGAASEPREFSLGRFVLTMLFSLAALMAILRVFAPRAWEAQLLAPLGKAVAAFFLLSFLNAFIEYFFHRYVLHTPAVPLLSRLYRQHTLHHALTRVARKPRRDGGAVLCIENKFPIVEPGQHEAAFFPWYSLLLFAAVLAPTYAVLQWLLPSFPWFLAGFTALAVSLTLYEVFHAINHWPFEKWEPLVTHRLWGKLWQPIYGFHLRHHAVTDCNESISGFFGLPVADWLLGTCVIPQTVYADGEPWTPDKFQSPAPRGLIRWLDERAKRSTQRRRGHAAD